MNRKIAALVAAGALIAGAGLAAGCGGDDDAGTGGGGGATTAATVEVTGGLVTDIGGINDRSFNFLANKGLEAAASELGFTPSVRESKAQTDYIPNIRRLVSGGNDTIITVGFLMGDATGKMAKQFPDATFAIVDFSTTDKAIGGAPNVRGLLFKEQEAGYLAGYLAGLMEKQTGDPRLNSQQVIGAVGGLKIPPVDRYIAGYKAGAEAANPGITVLVDYSQDFVDQGKCKEQSLAHIDKGSDIEFQVAGQCGLGTLSAAKDKNAYGIGVDADQAYLGDHVLTSALKRVDVAVQTAFKDKAAGTFAGGDDIFDLKRDGVGLGEISGSVPDDVKAEVDKIKQDIIDGKVTIPDTVP